MYLVFRPMLELLGGCRCNCNRAMLIEKKNEELGMSVYCCTSHCLFFVCLAVIAMSNVLLCVISQVMLLWKPQCLSYPLHGTIYHDMSCLASSCHRICMYEGV